MAEPDAAASLSRQDARRRESAADVGAAGGADADDSSADLGQDEQALRAWIRPKLIDGRRQFVGMHQAPDACPRLEVVVGLGGADRHGRAVRASAAR